MAYHLEIDFTKVEGYDKLTPLAKKLFESTYKKHNEQQGAEYKEEWIPIRVKERRYHLEVFFKNGKWQHYAPPGIWY